MKQDFRKNCKIRCCAFDALVLIIKRDFQRWLKKIKVKFLNNCRNDIGHELLDNNYMIYLPSHIVTHNVYSISRELTS
jgi:hypothetical protein